RPVISPGRPRPPGGSDPARARRTTAREPCSGELPADHLQGVAELLVHAHRGGRLVAGVDHAILAPRVLAVPVAIPGGLVDEVVERLVVDVGDQVARTLPAQDVASRARPGGAF